MILYVWDSGHVREEENFFNCKFSKFLLFTGFTTDGEFNSLRTKGGRRPISIIEIIKTARNSTRAMTVTVLKKYFQSRTQGSFFLIVALILRLRTKHSSKTSLVITSQIWFWPRSLTFMKYNLIFVFIKAIRPS